MGKIGGDEKEPPSFDEFYSVYRCRKVDCQRLLDKRCSKVSEGLRKMQHKLNNDGHTSALRRLPPCEREKLKQYQEAEGKNLLICPMEQKAAERSVPYCSHAMDRIGGYGKQTADGKDLPPDDDDFFLDNAQEAPSIPGKEDDDANAHDFLVNDDMLLELKKEDEDGDETPATKLKKGTKNKSQKKTKNILPLEFRPPANDEVYPETLTTVPAAKASQPAAWFVDPNTRNINGTAVSQAWNAASNDRRLQAAGAPTTQTASVPAATVQRPGDFANKVSMLMSTTSCTESQAKDLLEQCNYKLESAADAYFRQESGAEPLVEAKPRWGPRVGGQGQQSGDVYQNDV